MRSLLLILSLLASALPCTAQETAPPPPPPVGSNWQHVQALPIGAYIHVTARTRHMPCYLKAIDADTLTCLRDTGTARKDVLFQRPEIETIKLARRGRSAVFGALIGMGAGAGLAQIAGRNSNYFAVHGAFALIGGFAGLFAGAPTGYLTDFSASTIYRAR
jgi:hypothetical protein